MSDTTLTPQAIKNSEKAYEYCQQTIDLFNTLEEGALFLAKRLKDIRDREMYMNGWSSWGEFLGEMKMNEPKASKLISVYEVWVVNKGFSEKELSSVGWSNLYDARAFASREVLDELIHRQDKDARDYIRELKSGISQDDCKHDWVKIRFCSKCSTREKIYEEKN